MRRGFVLGSLAFLSALTVANRSLAETEAPLRVDPDQRNVARGADSAKGPSPVPPTLLSLSELAGELPEEKGPTHRRGGRPRVPEARLPDDVPLSAENQNARRAIATGPTAEELEGGPKEATLIALRNAERVLFPEPVRGLSSNWSFTLPERGDGEDTALGLPLVHQDEMADPALEADDFSWLKSLTMPDLPVRLDRRVVTYLKFYRDSPRGRTIAAIWAKKSGRYVAEMKAQLRRAGLPTDLVWLSMIESGHNPTIRSPAGAVGLWQFIPSSAEMYGLTVDRWVDERRDPARSTQAAVRFLSDLYRRFGNWELSMGAYNMGYAGMSRAVEKFNTNDYWALARMESGLPWETTLYVPKIFALAIVMNNRDAFGIGHVQVDPAVPFDTILVEPATTLVEVARAAGVSKESIEELNPQYLAGRLPPQEGDDASRWPLRVPRGKGEQAASRLHPGSTRPNTYLTKLGDSMELLATDFGLGESELRRQNAFGENEELQPGTVLLLPEGARPRAPGDVKQEIFVTREVRASQDQRRVFYRVVGDETLQDVAEAFSASSADVARWNVVNTHARLRPNMILQVLVAKNQDLSHVRVVEESEARVLISGSPQFHDFHESQKGKKRVVVLAKKGDTLARIGSRYGMSVGSMERVNRLSRRTELLEGQELIVYTSLKVRDRQSQSPTQPAAPLDPPHPELLP